MLIKLDELIEKYDIAFKGIIHIGAHHAEERDDYANHGVNRVIWIEANHRVFQHLMERVAHLPGHSYHWFAAHETNDKILELNVASNGESSSLLEFDTHAVEHPHVTMIGKVQVITRRIDDFFLDNGYDPKCFNFVNLDIQGAELLALRGMSKILEHVEYIYTEVNEKHLYKDCCLIGQLDEFLDDYGFSRVATHMTPFGWGDALYIKGKNSNWPIIERKE